MRQNFATIRDVASHAGVSASTVSRYLNGSMTLPPETSARIERARKQLSYRPNQLAKRLSLGSSELIGLVTPEIGNPFFSALAAAAEDEARLAGFSLLIISTGGDPRIEIASIDRLDSRHVDGLIVMTNRPDDGRLREILTGRRDVVLLDEDVPDADVARIFVENEIGAYTATRHLIRAGHRRIAHIGGPRDLFSARERFAGFVRAMREADVALDGSLVRFGPYDRAAGLSAIREFAGRRMPTAVFTGSDYIAVGVLDGLRQSGLSAPRDISIASFDDMPFADLLHPPLTTVRQPIEEMGRLGVRTLLARLRTDATAGVARLPTELVVRDSVGLPRSDAASPGAPEAGRTDARRKGARRAAFGGDRTTDPLSQPKRRTSMSALKNLVAAALSAVLAGSGAEIAAAAEKFSAVYVMSDNLGDKGFNDSAAAGFHRAEKEGVRIKLLQASASDPQLWRQNLEATSDSGTWSVIFTGPGMHDNLAAVAPKHPKQNYVYFDDELKLPNVLSVKYAQNEGSYLAGALAAAVTTDKAAFPLAAGTKKVGLVAGMDLPVIEDFIVGFKQGVATVDPSIDVQVSFIGNFNDAQKAYQLTHNMFDGGADIVYNVAGPAASESSRRPRIPTNMRSASIPIRTASTRRTSSPRC